jgi:hypothetical protein
MRQDDTPRKRRTSAATQAAADAAAEIYCQRCSNSRQIIRRGGINCFDTVPCERCRPDEYAAAMAQTAAAAS